MNYLEKKRLIKKTQNVSEYMQLKSNLNREIFLDIITPQNVQNINGVIRFWNQEDEDNGIEISRRIPIKIYIDTLGGNFNAMFTLIDTIKLSLTPVYTINIGTIQKEGFYIFLAGHKRFGYPNSTIVYERDLQHLDEMDKQANLYSNCYEKQLLVLKEIILEKTKITEAEYNKHLKAVWWINAEEAKNLRIYNSIVIGHKDLF